jgi:hypothetical protein
MEVITLESLLAIPAVSGMVYNDVLSLLSVIGSSFMFLSALFGAPLRRLGELGEWGMAPLIFGTLFQIAFLMIGVAPETEKIGFIIPMTPNVITGLFVASFLLLAGRWWLRRGLYRMDQSHY